MFKVTVEETTKDDPPEVIERYAQTVDAIDLKAVIKAINTKPRAPRVRKQKGEKQ